MEEQLSVSVAWRSVYSVRVCMCECVCACVAEKCKEEAACLNIHFCSLSNPGTAAGIKGGS